VQPAHRSSTSQRARACYDGGSVQDGSTGSALTDGTVDGVTAAAENATASDEAVPPLFEACGVTKQFDCSSSVVERWLEGARTLTAVDGVDLAVTRGETVGIVGESGSGKSTLAKLLTGLQTPTNGEILFDGEPVDGIEARSTEQLRDVGVVFQNPQDSINPRFTVREAIAESLVEAGWSQADRTARVNELLDLVELGAQYASRRPHQLSGGQLQRVAIARAIALEPQVVVFDEPVSALDLSTQAKLLTLLVDIQERLDLTYVVISHDLGVVQLIADRVAVMYEGQIVERGRPGHIFEQPAHFHTAALIEATTENK
jgi:peptide/nickel transport system ATP-binding protein